MVLVIVIGSYKIRRNPRAKIKDLGFRGLTTTEETGSKHEALS